MEHNGKTYDLIPLVRMLRPDGTLAAETSFNELGQPQSWSYFDKTGMKRTFYANTNGVQVSGASPRRRCCASTSSTRRKTTAPGT